MHVLLVINLFLPPLALTLASLYNTIIFNVEWELGERLDLLTFH